MYCVLGLSKKKINNRKYDKNGKKNDPRYMAGIRTEKTI